MNTKKANFVTVTLNRLESEDGPSRQERVIVDTLAMQKKNQWPVALVILVCIEEC